MDFLTERKYSFISNDPSLSDDTFGVVNFKGFEGISRPYEFDSMLVSDNPEINLSDVLQKSFTFTIHHENGGLVSTQEIGFKTVKTYPAIDYVCQYGESHFTFVSRWEK